MAKKIYVNSIAKYPETLDELNSLLVQGAEATIEDGKVVITYEEERAKPTGNCLSQLCQYLPHSHRGIVRVKNCNLKSFITGLVHITV